MFGFLRSGKYNSAYSGLPGFTDGRNDELRYNLLSYSDAMRKNISLGHPLFQSVCNPEGAIEGADNTSEAGTTESAHNFAKKNAALAEIFAKELTFLNRTIQMIALIASRYHEEQEDAAAYDHDHDRKSDDSDSDLELQQESGDNEDEDDSCPALLRRSSSSPSDASVYANASNASNASNAAHNNQLSNSLLICSGQLMRSLQALCGRVGLDLCLVYAMTTADKPVSMKTLGNQRTAGYTCVLALYTRFCTFQNNDRGEVVEYFQELQNISQSAWDTMSLLAFTNLYRLTQGTDFEMDPVNPDDAILANRGRPFVARMGKPACSSSVETSFFGRILPSSQQQQQQPDDADADADADADTGTRCGHR